MKIQSKLTFAMFFFGAALLISISAIYYFKSHKTILEEASLLSIKTSDALSHYYETFLIEKAKIAVTLANTPIIRESLIKSNDEFAALSEDERKERISIENKHWMETKDMTDHFISARMNNPVANYLHEQHTTLPDEYGEIFLTNRYGVMIATTKKLTTLAHAHKYWWVASFYQGKGRIFFDDRGFDESVRGYVLGIVVPVMMDNQIIGILKCNLNILGALDLLMNALEDSIKGRIKIVRSSGIVVYEQGSEPLSTKIDEKLFEAMTQRSHGSKIHNDSGGVVAFSGYAPVALTQGTDQYGFGGTYKSIDHIQGNTGECWFVVITRELQEVLEPLTDITKWIIGSGIVFIFFMALLSHFIGKSISRPIIQITRTAEKIGKGDFTVQTELSSRDEVGILAASIDQMGSDLQESMATRDRLLESLNKIEWLLGKGEKAKSKQSLQYKTGPPHSDLTELNTCRIILDFVGKDVLDDITSDYIHLLGTSVAIYEKNGDYAYGIFTSGWCNLLNSASRNLCETDDDRKALESGKWLCHESCWTDCSSASMQTGQPVDIECRGGIRLYSVPIRSKNEIIGSINFGYSDPPTEPSKLEEISARYGIGTGSLLEQAKQYDSRPPYIVGTAKNRLQFTARLIGAIVERRHAEEKLKSAHDELDKKVQMRTAELNDVNEQLKQEISERKEAEDRIRRLNLLNEDLLMLDSIDKKVKRITDAVVEIFGADFSRIWEIKPGDRCETDCPYASVTDGPHVCRNKESCLHLQTSSGRYTHIDGELHCRIPFGCYKIGRAAAGEDPKFITSDVTHDPHVHDHDWARKLGLVSFAGYRLLSDDGMPMGVLALFSKHNISPDDDALLESLANTAAQMLQKAKAEEALKESEEKFRELAELLPQPVFEMDTEFFFTYANRSGLEAFGYTKEAFEKGVHALQLFHLEEGKRVEQDIRKRLTGVEFDDHEYIGVRKDRSTFPILLYSAPIIRDEKAVGVRGIVIDISERKLAEKALKKYAETQAVLLREVNHRVKNNLSAIIGMLLKEQDHAEVAGTTAYLDVLGDLIGRVEGLSTVHSMLSSSGWQALLLTELCEQVIHAALQGVPLKKEISVDVKSSSIRVSSNQAHHLTLVINELTTNAIKHALGKRKPVEIQVEIFSDDHMTRIIFKDNGPGYPDEMLRDGLRHANVGFELIFGIVKESLRGNVFLENDNGARTTIVFKSKTADEMLEP